MAILGSDEERRGTNMTGNGNNRLLRTHTSTQQLALSSAMAPVEPEFEDEEFDEDEHDIHSEEGSRNPSQRSRGTSHDSRGEQSEDMDVSYNSEESRYEKEYNDLLDRKEDNEEVDEDRLYSLELLDRRRHGEELTDEELDDLEQFEDDEKARIKSQEDSGEFSVSLRDNEPAQSFSDEASVHEKEYNDLLDRKEDGEEVDEGRLYFLELLDRRRHGEELTDEEFDAIDQFEEDEIVRLKKLKAAADTGGSSVSLRDEDPPQSMEKLKAPVDTSESSISLRDEDPQQSMEELKAPVDTGESSISLRDEDPPESISSEASRYEKEYNDLFDRRDAGEEVEEERLYFLELLDKQRHGEDLTDEELDDIDQFLEDEEQLQAEKSGEDDRSVRNEESGEGSSRQKYRSKSDGRPPPPQSDSDRKAFGHNSIISHASSEGPSFAEDSSADEGSQSLRSEASRGLDLEIESQELSFADDSDSSPVSKPKKGENGFGNFDSKPVVSENDTSFANASLGKSPLEKEADSAVDASATNSFANDAPPIDERFGKEGDENGPAADAFAIDSFGKDVPRMEDAFANTTPVDDALASSGVEAQEDGAFGADGDTPEDALPKELSPPADTFGDDVFVENMDDTFAKDAAAIADEGAISFTDALGRTTAGDETPANDESGDNVVPKEDTLTSDAFGNSPTHTDGVFPKGGSTPKHYIFADEPSRKDPENEDVSSDDAFASDVFGNAAVSIKDASDMAPAYDGFANTKDFEAVDAVDENDFTTTNTFPAFGDDSEALGSPSKPVEETSSKSSRSDENEKSTSGGNDESSRSDDENQIESDNDASLKSEAYRVTSSKYIQENIPSGEENDESMSSLDQEGSLKAEDTESKSPEADEKDASISFREAKPFKPETYDQEPAGESSGFDSQDDPSISLNSDLYEDEYNNMLDRKDDGEHVDEDRLHLLELMDRRRNAEHLSDEEHEELEKFEAAEKTRLTAENPLTGEASLSLKEDESITSKGVEEQSQRPGNDEPDYEKEYNDLLDRQDAGDEVDEDRLYCLELMDRRRHEEDLTDEELDDLEQFEESEAVRLKAEDPLDSEAVEESISFKGEESISPTEDEELSQTPTSVEKSPSLPSTNDQPDYEKEYNDLIDRQDAGGEVDDDRLYMLELMDRRREGEDLTGEELSDLEQFEDDEKGRLKAQDVPDEEAVEESTSFKGEKSISEKEVEKHSQTPASDGKLSSPTTTNDQPDYEKEYNALIDRQDAGGEVDDDRLYMLELMDRRREGEDLTDEELSDLEQFEKDEEARMKEEISLNPEAIEESISLKGEDSKSQVLVVVPTRVPQDASRPSTIDNKLPPQPSNNDDPDYEKEYNDLIDRRDAREEVDEDRLYCLELMDRRREQEDLTDEELDDLEQFEEDEKVRLKAENPPDMEAGEESIVFNGEKSMSPKEIEEPSQRPEDASQPSTIENKFPSQPSKNDDPDYEKEYNDLLDRRDAREEVDEDRLYCLELMDRRREQEDLTDEELSDLEQFEEDEKVRLKAENPPDMEAGEESIVFNGEKSMSPKEIEEPSQRPEDASQPSTIENKFSSQPLKNDEPDYEREYNDLLDRRDAGEEVDEDRLYCLELMDRRRHEEDLTDEELDDLEHFEDDENVRLKAQDIRDEEAVEEAVEESTYFKGEKSIPEKEVEERSQTPASDAKSSSPTTTNDQPDYEKEYNELLDRQDAGGEVDDDRLYKLELTDRRREGEDLTDEELSDLEQFEKDEEARMKKEIPLNPEAIEESISLRGEDSISQVLVAGPTQAPEEPPQPSTIDNKSQSPLSTNDDPDYEKEYNDLLDRQDAGVEVDEDRLYCLELMDRRREREDLTDEELSDLEQFEEDEKVRLKAENPPDLEAGEESISFNGEESIPPKKDEVPSQTPASVGHSPSPPSTKKEPDYAKEYNDLLDRQDAGDEVDEDRLYSLELMDRRREGEDLTDEELSDLEQFEDDEKVRLKTEDHPNSEADEESMSFKAEESTSPKKVEELSQTPASGGKSPSPPSNNDEPDYVKEYNDLLDRQDAGDEVDEDRLYCLELMDRRREGEDLTDEELDDLEQFEEDEKVRLKAENPPDSDAGEESISFKGEDLRSEKKVEDSFQTPAIREPDYEKEYNDLLDHQDAGEEVDEDRLYCLELMDRRRHEEDLTDEELDDLEHFEEDEKVRLKAENPPDLKAVEESISFKGEESISLKEVEEPSQTPQEPSPAFSNAEPDYEKEYNELLDRQDVGEEVDEDRLYCLELMDRRRHEEGLTDEELGDLEQFVTDEKVRLMAENSPDPETSEATKSLKIEVAPQSFVDDEPGYEKEYNGLLDRQDAGEEVDEDRLYFLELWDRRQHSEDLTDEEINDLEQFEGDEKERRKTKGPEADRGKAKEAILDEEVSLSGEASRYEKEYNDLLDRQDAGGEVDEDRLYLLELWDRRKHGEELNDEELDDLDEFEDEEKKKLKGSHPAEESEEERAARYDKEYNDLLDHQDAGEEVDEDRLYLLELFDRRQHGEVLTDEELDDLDEFGEEEQEKRDSARKSAPSGSDDKKQNRDASETSIGLNEVFVESTSKKLGRTKKADKDLSVTERDDDEFNKSLPKPGDVNRKVPRRSRSAISGSGDSSKQSRSTDGSTATGRRGDQSKVATKGEKAKSSPSKSKTKDSDEKKKKKKKKKKRQKSVRSEALLDLVANVNEAMLDMEGGQRGEDGAESKENNLDSSAHRLLHGFEALLGIFLQLSDELELISTFAKSKKKKDVNAMAPVQALKAVLSFAQTLDQLFAELQPILQDCFEEEPDEEMDDMLYRLNSLVDLLCETTHRVGDKQEWNERVETTYVTLLELMEHETLELTCYVDDVDPPEYELSANIHEAWSATGHIEELRALQHANDPWVFRQVCYEVMVSTDQWCPDTTMLMEICGIDASMLEEEPDQEYLDEEELAPIPQAAEHVLDKVNGDPLPRSITMASILRRILPPRAMTDATLLDNFTSIRNTLRNPLGLSATNIVSISSIPEVLNDPDALGVGGMGKTTLAAMVAAHPDVRRYFIDGVVWVYVGDKELNYSRYTQCLRELVAQLDWYQGIPLFAELLHTPGEMMSKRRRREEGFMIYARDTIAELLHDRSVLIILDDVCFEPDLDWFDFAPMPGESVNEENTCALLVTTRCRALLPAADTVEIDMLDEADSISLLIQESGQLSHSLMAESREARSVVRECANHPLAVKSVGRWLNLKHATAGVVSSVEEIHAEVIKSMDKILKGGDHNGADMMYEVLSLSLSPAINGEATSIIKFCLASFVMVFCDKAYISDFALTEPTPIIPMDMAELLFETLLEMNESSLLKEGSLFYAQKKEAAVLIPEALSALGVLKVITYSDSEEAENPEDEQKFLQIMHFIHQEYGEYLCKDDEILQDLTKDAERQWNRALVEAYLAQVEEWDVDLDDARHSYALEMIVSHMIRGAMYSQAADLLANKNFVRGRLLSLGRENATRRHIKDCEMLFKKVREHRPSKGRSKLEPRTVMKHAYQALGSQLSLEDEEQSAEDPRIRDVEVARAHYEIGFSLAEKRCWDAAIAHWETSQELLVAALGTVEVVAGILYNIGVVYSEMNEYEQALDSLKQCLRIRGTIHGEEHILYAQTIQKIGDIFLGMSDYHEAMESYNWALDVMYSEPSHHRVDIGEILDHKGSIHYSKGEIEEALQCHQDALRSKQVDLGEDHPELAGTYHHIGNCLSDQGNIEDAIVHFEEAIRLKELDPEGGPERDADVLTIEGVLHNLEGNQEQGLECYEKSLQILVTKVPHRKEKVASLLHLIGCVYLMSGEQKKAMKLFEESLQARRKVLGFVHLDVASTLFNMAFLHQTRNRLDKALKCLEEALKIRQLRLPDSEKVAVTHEKIGTLARAIGKTKKAQIAFEEALRIRKLIHGEQHEAVATVLQELGDLMDDLGEYDYAMNYYIDALDIRRNRLGPDDVAVAETLYSMGFTLHNNDASDRALVCFEESLSIRRFQLGEDSKEVGDTLNMMGFLKAKRGELDDALTLLWDALRIRKLQEDHVKVSETLKNIGNVHREKQEQELAVECYEECLRIRRAELGTEHEKVADALIAMGNVQSDMERLDEAMRSYQEALKIRTVVHGEHDESVAAVLQYMGTMEFRAGNHEKARDLLTEFIRIRRDNDTKNDGDYVNVLFMIGNIHKMQGNEDEAQLCWSEAYQVFTELGLAEGNPQIAKVMNHLLKVEINQKEPEEKRKTLGAGVFGKLSTKLKDTVRDDKMTLGKKRRKGKGQQLL